MRTLRPATRRHARRGDSALADRFAVSAMAAIGITHPFRPRTVAPGVPRTVTSSPPDVGDLYRRYGATVLRRVRHFYRDPEEAEEVLHEVFERVLVHIGTFAGNSSPVTWLYQIATRHCINRLRDTRRRRELLDENGDVLDWGSPVSSASQEAGALFRDLWRKLDAELVEIGVYYHLDGMTHDEIARVMGVSRRTVGNRLVELERAARAIGGTP